MNATEKQAWLDGLKVGDRVFCSYYEIEAYSPREAILIITHKSMTQFVTGGVGVKFRRTGGAVFGKYRGYVEPLTLSYIERVSEQKEYRKLLYWFTELKANDLTTEQLNAMKKAYEGVAK